MYIQLDLNPASQTYNDLLIQNNDLVLVDGLSAIKQDILQRLRFYLGEWFLDTTKGVPYFQQILIKNPDQSKIDAIFINTILNTPGVITLTAYSFDLDSVNRILNIKFTAQTTSGTVDYAGLVATA